MLGFVCGQRLAIIQTAQAAASSPQISNAPTPPAPSQGTPRTSPTPQPGQQPPPPAAAPRLQAGVPQPNAVVVQLGAYATLSDAYLALARLQADQHERYEAARAELNQVAAEKEAARRAAEEEAARAAQEAAAATAAAEAAAKASEAARAGTPTGKRGAPASKPAASKPAAPSPSPAKGGPAAKPDAAAQEAERAAQAEAERLVTLAAVPPVLAVCWRLDGTTVDPADVDVAVALGASLIEGPLPLGAPGATKWNRLLAVTREAATLARRREERERADTARLQTLRRSARTP